MIVSIICYPLVDCLVAPATCGSIADCLHILVALLLPCTRLTVASMSPCHRLAVTSTTPCRRLAPPFTHHHHHHVHVRSRHPTRTATATAIAIGIVGRYPYRCYCHHRCRTSHRRLRCLRRRCPDLSVATEPAIICEGPNGRTTKTRYGIASAAASVATEVAE